MIFATYGIRENYYIRREVSRRKDIYRFRALYFRSIAVYNFRLNVKNRRYYSTQKEDFHVRFWYAQSPLKSFVHIIKLSTGGHNT